MNAPSSEKLTTPDLVLLSLLAEQPMHGYQANALLEFRKVRDWAGVSRPQVYYSLDKLARLGLLESSAADAEQKAGGTEGADSEPADTKAARKIGPDRHVFATTSAGRAALAEALEREDWTQQLDRPAFLTWLALSWQAKPSVFARQLKRRQEFLEAEQARKSRILQDVLTEVGHPFHEAVWMLSLSLEQIKTELNWLDQVMREASRRGAARHPAAPQA